MLRKFVLLAAAMGFLAVTVLEGSVAARGGSLQIKGSDTMVNLVQAWAEEYMNVHPEAFIAVTGGGSGTGFASLINGTCDIAMTSRNIKAKEIALARKKGVFPKEYTVALDGMAVVVHPDNPLSELTLKQLADIFMGTITNWNQLGGADAPIVLLSREVNSGTHVYFKEHVLKKAAGGKNVEFSPDALLLPSSQAIADEVTQNPDAIGYYGMGYISPGQKALSIAKDAESGYVYPEIEHVTSGAYPISRPLFMYTQGEPEGDVKDFLDFILSEEGQQVVLTVDFVPVK